MAKSMVKCANCGIDFLKENKEINRINSRGGRHFCSRSCSAIKGNEPNRTPEIVKKCKFCGRSFTTKANRKEGTFCSSSCASKGSITDVRRKAQRESGFRNIGNLLSASETLKLREAWKYVELEERLHDIAHEFEYELDGCVFDLMLEDDNILVEFDGKYHRLSSQIERDSEKDKIAKAAGFQVRRIIVKPPKLRRGTIVKSMDAPPQSCEIQDIKRFLPVDKSPWGSLLIE